MALVSNADVWHAVASDIKVHYSQEPNRDSRYFLEYESTAKNPLEGLVNQWHDKFFGPKVCGFFIIGYPYGEKGTGNTVHIEWPPDGYQDSKDKLKLAYDAGYWTFYELNFFLDLTILKKVRSVDSSAADKLDDLLQEVSNHIREDCEGEMAAYGWHFIKEYQEDDTPRADDFYPILDDFYHKISEGSEKLDADSTS